MAKPQASFVCQACGAVSNRWAGKCEACGDWNTIVAESGREAVPKGMKSGKAASLEWQNLSVAEGDETRVSTSILELDRVLGGGLVKGSAVLIGGDPGIGKSTLLLQVAAHIGREGHKVAYVTGEESTAQVALRAKRLGLSEHPVDLTAATNVRDIIHALEAAKPHLAIIDSIQTMFIDNIEAAPGTVTQVRACAHELIRMAKKRGISLFLVGHVTKDGQIAGPRVLEHMVDTVLYFEGERGVPFRILRAVKNRFGGTDEIGVFEMADVGLKEVANPSALLLSERKAEVSGAVVFAGMEGTRPVLVEIQALVAPSYMSSPRRAVVGWDANRLAMILAVLETRCGVRFSDKEVYLSVAGGIRISEPAADLAVAAALVSALMDTPAAQDAVFFGEIGLSGEIRQVARADARMKEAEKLGFKAAYTRAAKQPSTMNLKPIETVQALVASFK
jgi:DNA repair protein RadA/Sms